MSAAFLAVLVRPVVGLDMRGETIYSLMVDRFYDGNSANNYGDGTMNVLTHPTPNSGTEAEWKKYWGGDIQGIIQKLDYLQSVGITAVWLSPIMQNVNGIDNKGTTAYHGYWVNDYFRVEEHFGTWTDVYNLANALHARGMKLIMDITPNHSNPIHSVEYGSLYRNGQWLANYAGDNWSYYHHYEDSSQWGDDRWKDVNLPLQDLADYNNGSPAIDNYLIDAAKAWLDAGVDAFRIDAIKHIDWNFLQLFTTALNNYAYTTLGRSQGVYFFGEWFDGGAGNPDSMAFVNGNYNTELLDFNLRKKIENAMGNNLSMNDLNAHLEQREAEYLNSDKQVLFIDNHDLSRFLLTLDQYYNMDYTTAKKRLEMALTLIMTARGIPCVYYGTEQYASTYIQTSEGNWGSDPYNREMLTTWDTTTTAASIIKTLSDLRKSSPALQGGLYDQKWGNDSILVYERKYNNESVVVAINRGNTATITVSDLGLANGTYKNALGTETFSVNNGSSVMTLPANSAVVLKGTGTTNVGTGLRTVVFINKETYSGQDIFIRGGHDADLVTAGHYPSMTEPIQYNNLLNPTTLSYKQNDPSLDWSTDSALDWTTSAAAGPWHVANNLYYSTVGYGVDPENTWGMHWWKFDVTMQGTAGDWFEFKAFMRESGRETWENNISQSGTPYSTINHWGRKGYMTRVYFGNSWVEYSPLSQ